MANDSDLEQLRSLLADTINDLDAALPAAEDLNIRAATRIDYAIHDLESALRMIDPSFDLACGPKGSKASATRRAA